jgi:hypothetical protein
VAGDQDLIAAGHRGDHTLVAMLLRTSW